MTKPKVGLSQGQHSDNCSLFHAVMVLVKRFNPSLSLIIYHAFQTLSDPLPPHNSAQWFLASPDSDAIPPTVVYVSLCLSPQGGRKLGYILRHQIMQMDPRPSRILIHAQQLVGFDDGCKADCDLIVMKFCAKGHSVTDIVKEALHRVFAQFFHNITFRELGAETLSPLERLSAVHKDLSKCCRKGHTSVRNFSFSAASFSISFFFCTVFRIWSLCTLSSHRSRFKIDAGYLLRKPYNVREVTLV